MTSREKIAFYKLVIFLWTSTDIVAHQLNNQRIGNGGADDSNQGSTYFFYQRPQYPKDCQEVQDQCSSNNSSGVYIIKPDDYSEPFEVYCDNSQDSGGWTVLHRRLNGDVHFGRNWTDYKLGFGFLSQEFWLGNQKLSHLTNQKKYKLRIEMTNSDDISFFATYDNFRLSDEFSNYNMASLGEYSGNAESFTTWCRTNRQYGNCTCQRTCDDPHGCLNTCSELQTCICPEEYYLKEGICVPPEECACYAFQTFIPEGELYANSDCTKGVVCINGQLSWDDSYACGSNAACEERDDVRKCYCNSGYTGDGKTCIRPPPDCLGIYNAGITDSGVYLIKPSIWPGSPFAVYCNMSDGGGWTVFQRRVDGTVDFYQSWNTYKAGFGSADNEVWIGNEKLYYLTNQKRYTIRIDLVNRNGVPYYAKFDNFRISNEIDKYRLTQLGTYTGTADSRSSPDGYALRYHLNQPFSTHDRDNDANSNNNCAEFWHGAWWYKDVCHKSNLNGDFNGIWGNYESIYWYYLPGSPFNVEFTEMKLRPY